MHNRIPSLALIVVISLLFSCNRSAKEVTVTEQPKTESIAKPKPLPTKPSSENYYSFYAKFHKDSLFQMSRIKFPIDGYYTDSIGQEQAWTEQNWIMHRAKIQEADTAIYKVELSGGRTMKDEKLYIDGGGFRIERKFQQINGKWYLVYYTDENL